MSYPRTVLQFGGGKDSLACLYYLEPEWNEITVMWMNTGAAFPEIIEQMQHIRALVPHFYEVRSDVFTDIANNGWPADVVPTHNLREVTELLGTEPLRLQHWLSCCARNMWVPLDTACRELGATEIIRGQRLAEFYKSDLRDGAVVNGVLYSYPLQDWSEDQVFEFLHKRGIKIPEYYEWTNTSLDCWTCTAYMDAKLGQLEYMRQFHPEKHRLVVDKLKVIRDVTVAAMVPLEKATQMEET